MKNILNKIKQEQPLVHHITNNVTINDTANITLYWGGLPVMASNPEEVQQMVSSASALLLNLGAIDYVSIEPLIKAGKRANELGIPVVFDPVGAGATKFRTDQALKLLDSLELAAIKGNPGEITILAGAKAEVKGVEAVGEYENLIGDSRALAEKQDTVILVTGSEDLVTDGEEVYKIKNGTPMLGKVVGTGCMLGSTLGVFTGVESDYMQAVLAGGTAFSIAGELAAAESQLPASFKLEFLDQVSLMNEEIWDQEKEITKIKEEEGA